MYQYYIVIQKNTITYALLFYTLYKQIPQLMIINK